MMNPWLQAFLMAMIGTAQLAAASAVASRAKPNVVLITIDTVRADHVGCYGATGVSTPTLDALARDGIVFERALAQVPLTFPSHAAIMTGLFPFQNGAQDFTSPPLDSRFRTIAQALRDHGYSTGAVVSSFAVDHSWGLARGFDFYDDAFSQASYNQRELGLVERKAGESVKHALSWLQETHGRPFFLWLHLYDPHSPYNPPEPFQSEYAGHLYDGEIAYADHELGHLIQWLKQTHLYGRTLIVVVSDHGESLGDHGEKEHGFFLYNSTLRVPLIIKPPQGAGYKPGRNQNVVEISAIPSTILRIARLSDPMAKTALPLAGGAGDSRGVYSETFYPFNSFGWSPLHSLQIGRFHFIDAPAVELYDVMADPEEKDNLAPTQGATVAVLREKLDTVLQADSYKPVPGTASTLSPEAQQKLRSLGYFAYRSPVPQTALLGGLADPKIKLSEFNALLEGQDAVYAGDFKRGRLLLNAIREKDPRMYIVPFYLGEASLAQQEWDEASAEFKNCLHLSPEFEQAMTGLARSLMFQGKTDEAREWAQKALVINPQSYQALYELGFLESKRDRKRAINYYKSAIAIQPSSAPLLRDLGLLELQEGSFAESARDLERAVALGLDDPSILNSLGIAYGRTQRPDKSVEAYKKALALKPDAAEVHLNLAAAYDRLHRPEQAKVEYDKACKLSVRYCH
jgi:arylsulfatase A-like enzyme/tetratricopeptide (TPR) repeat protein